MSCMDQSEAILRTGARHLGACGIVSFGFCVWDPSCVILCLDCCVWDLSCGIFRLGFCVWDLSYMIDSLGLCVWDLSCGIFSFCVWYRSCVSLCFGFPMWDRSRGIFRQGAFGWEFCGELLLGIFHLGDSAFARNISFEIYRLAGAA